MDNKAHDSRVIANLYVEKARERGDRLTIMPLVKYVYLAHGWTLGWMGEPLISHKVEAWKFGPVVREVYETFRPQGIIISEQAEGHTAEGLGDRQKRIVNNVYDAYSVLSAFEISGLTHGPNSPWYRYRNHHHAEIPVPIIQEHYEKAVERVKKKNEQG